MPEGSRDNIRLRCEQGNDLLSLVAQLKEVVKRPRSIREYKTGSSLSCSLCALVKDLQKQGVKLQETVKRLRDIVEAERELDSWFQAPLVGTTAC